MMESNSIVSWTDYLKTLQTFETRLVHGLKDLGILDICKNLSIDHACIRFSNSDQVNALREELRDLGQEISSAQVNGREIVIVQLHEPIKIGHWQVKGLELPYPKKIHSFDDGWEHVEFVLPDATNTIEGMREAFLGKFGGLELQTLKADYHYKEDAPHADSDQLPNPTIAIKINGIGFKFHANSIQDVVSSG